MDHDVGDRRDGSANALLDRARLPVRVREGACRREREREEDDDAVVGPHEAELARRRARLLSYRGLDRCGVDVDLLAGRRLPKRLEVRLNDS